MKNTLNGILIILLLAGCAHQSKPTNPPIKPRRVVTLPPLPPKPAPRPPMPRARVAPTAMSFAPASVAPPPVPTEFNDLQISSIYRDPEDPYWDFYIISAIQRSNSVIRFDIKQDLNAPWYDAGSWGVYPVEQRVGIGMEAHRALRIARTFTSAPEPPPPAAAFAPTAVVARQAEDPTTDTGRVVRIKGKTYSVLALPTQPGGFRRFILRENP